jgi:hypothetical protein
MAGKATLAIAHRQQAPPARRGLFFGNRNPVQQGDEAWK